MLGLLGLLLGICIFVLWRCRRSFLGNDGPRLLLVARLRINRRGLF